MLVSRAAALAALSLAFGVPASSQPAAQVITLWSFGYSPNPIHLRAGRPVMLTFVDRKGSHNFVAKAFFASSSVIAGSAPGGRVELSAGQTRSITLVPRAGVYDVHCSHFLHAAMGMTDRIIVD